MAPFASELLQRVCADAGLFNALYMRRSEASASGPPMAMR
jgi:hypothetical protein